MEKEKKESNNSGILVTALVIALLFVTALGGYFVGALRFSSSMIKEQQESNNVKEEVVEPEEEVAKESTKEEKSPYRTCVGTYKGTGPVSVNAQTKETTNGEYTLSLNEDGTFEYSTGLTGEKGYYVVLDNTLIFMHGKHVIGPKDEEPSIVSTTYLISEDCSKILFDGLGFKEKVNLVRE